MLPKMGEGWHQDAENDRNGYWLRGLPRGFRNRRLHAYFMWSQDWGPMGTRGHNLMFVLMLFGAIVIYFVTLMAFGFVAVTIDKELGK